MIGFWISVLCLWIVYCWFFRQYLIDSARQKLFDLRDNLYDYALQNEISFDAHAYGMLRSTLNASIRHAHHFSFLGVLVSLFVYDDNDEEVERHYQKLTSFIWSASCREQRLFSTNSPTNA